jgi:hypothetical protein
MIAAFFGGISIPSGAGGRTTFDTCLQIISKGKRYNFVDAALRVASLQENRIVCTFFTIMWQTESPSSYACGDQSHIPAKIRNVLIPFQKKPCLAMAPKT